MTRHERNDEFALTSFLHGANATFLTELYASYQNDPASVDSEWRSFFASLGDAADDVLAEARGPSWSKKNGTALSTVAPPAFNQETALAASRDTLGARLLIRAYRTPPSPPPTHSSLLPG